jgi:predicted glycosyltransferase
LPAYLKSIKAEHVQLESFIFKHKICGVISDNRYGLWAENVPSVLVTHQLNPLGQGFTKWFEGLASKRIRKFASRFSFVWLPDNKAHTLSGKLSEQREMWDDLRYVGLLSRFSRLETRIIENDIVVVLSGPEPARTEFDRDIMEALSALSGKKILVIRGLPEAPELRIKGNINVVNYLSRDDLSKAISSAKLVISRSGYSSVMDYARLGVKAAFIPTPGQTEQRYLAEQLMENKIAPFQNQKQINLNSLTASLPYFSGFQSLNIETKIEGPMKEFLRRI